ncbi:MAG: glycosyltransferase family 4 protein [Fibrobacteres bacterium]|nr:glycosyltransferase family 4 protein [Fibrobacterota bacterium]
MQRLLSLLRGRGFSVTVFDPNRYVSFKGQIRLALLRTLLFGRYQVVHFQGFDFPAWFIGMTVRLRSILGFKFFITAHSFRFGSAGNTGELDACRMALAGADALIAVHASVLAKCREAGMPMPPKLTILPAFIPPDENRERDIWGSYPPDVPAFLSRRRPILVANAFKIIFFENADLYGLDLCIELLARLHVRYPDLGFIFALADDSAEPDYLGRMKSRILELSLREHFLILSGQRELWPLLRRAQVFIRPTNTDGDAISIREAIHFGIPVVASDACVRPDEVVLFASRDLDDLEGKVAHVLGKKRPTVQV